MEVNLIGTEFGAIVSGLRLNGSLPDHIAKQVEDGLDRYSVLIFRNTELSDDEYTRFGRSFGKLEDFALSFNAPRPCLPISNLDEQGHIRSEDDPMRLSIAADALWHTDNSYRPERARYSMLLARNVPGKGGETEICDTRAAYDALPEATKQRLEGLVGLHSIIYSRGLVGFTGWTEKQRAALHPVPQPLVMQNPRTGRRSLYIASHICEIVGWPIEDARKFVHELIEFATQPQFVYAHRWRTGDLVIWDDRATMHRRAPYDDLNEVREFMTLRVVEKSQLYRPPGDELV